MKEWLSLCSCHDNPSTKLVRIAEGHVQMVKRCIQKLRTTTTRRTRNNTIAMEEFDEVSQSVLGACDDKLFNLHQGYTC